MSTPMTVIAAVAQAVTGHADAEVALAEFFSDNASRLTEESRTLLFDFISSRTLDPDRDPEFESALQGTLRAVADLEKAPAAAAERDPVAAPAAHSRSH